MEPPIDSACILCIEDEQALREELEDELRGFGFEVLTAANSDEAERILERSQPDIVLCDVMMPGRNGFELLADLRQSGKLPPHAAFIFLTGLTDREKRLSGLQRGADGYLTKPIDRDQLAEVLRKYEGGDRSAPALVVDDEPANRDVLRKGLERAGWSVVEAENGQVALDRVAEAVPRLILLDLMMPVMDGFEFVAELRKNEAWRQVPVLVVTAKEITAEDRVRLEGHVSRILQKGSFGQQELVREVRKLVRVRG